MLANPVDQKTLWYQCCRSNLAKLQTAAVFQVEKLSPSKAEFGQLPKVIYSSLLNKTSFAVSCVTDAVAWRAQGVEKLLKGNYPSPPAGKHWKIFACSVGCDETMDTEWTEAEQWILLHGFTPLWDWELLLQLHILHAGVNWDSDSTKILHQSSRNVDFSFSIRFYLCFQVLKLAPSILGVMGEGEKIFLCYQKATAK